MMKKRMKQLLALALSTSMLALSVGCGSTTTNNNSESSESKETLSTAQTETSSVSTETEELVEDITYPLTTDVKLTIWDQGYVRTNAQYVDYTESPFHTGLADKTGVDVEWKFRVKGTNATETWNLLLTEEHLPDIVFRSWSVTEGEQLIEDGAIYDLTEYLPKYAPDYWETINKPEYANSLKAMTTASGKQFIVASFGEETANITYMGPVVRKDWLDECGLGIPETLEDWEKMLVAFKDKYGIAPLAMTKDQFLNQKNVNSGVGACGALAPCYYLEDGKVGYANATAEWKEYLTVLNKWYNEGLIDKDSVTMDNAAMRSKALTNEVGVSFVPLSQLSNWVADAEAENTGAEWIAVSYPREAEGVPTCMIQTSATHWSNAGCAISTALSEEELIVALQWLNYGYTEEGAMYWNYGEEGEHYTMDAEGKPAFTELITEDVNGIGDAVTKYTGVASSGIALQDLHFVKLKNPGVGADAITVWTENTEGPEHSVPNLGLSTDENLIHSNLYIQFATYTVEMGLKFVTGEESLDNYDAYVAKLNSMGLQQCIDIYQNAYERFVAK